MYSVKYIRHCLCSLTLLVLISTCALGADRSAAELLPASTVVYVEMGRPQELLTMLMEHPLRGRIESLYQVAGTLEKKEYLDFKAGVAVVESQMGLAWPKLLGQVVGEGLVVAVDSKTQGLALLARATDDTTPGKLVETLVNLVKLDAMNKGMPDPVKTGEYRGLKAFAVDKAKFVVFDRWLLVSNKDDFAKQIVDRWLDAPQQSLASDSQFTTARQLASDGHTVWGYVNTTAIREADLAKELFRGQADNPAGELLLGGILSTLQHTPYVTLSLALDAGQLRAAVSAVHDRSWAGEAREYFFGPQGNGRAPAWLLADESLLTVSAYRDISAMWQRAGDLFNERTNEELAKADSNLSTLFGGKDFGEDILGALHPEVQVVVTRQSFATDKPTPAIKLPAFALVSELKDTQKMQPELRRTFQSLIGFLNVVGAMQGQPQLDIEMEKIEGGQIVASRYLPDPNAKDPLGLKINYNFSPSIAFTGNRFVVSSTEELARKLAPTFSPAQRTGDGDQLINTEANLRFNVLREILADNQGQLVAQNMLKEGNTKEKAEQETQMLLDLVSWFDQAKLRLATTERELRLTLDVQVKAPEK